MDDDLVEIYRAGGLPEAHALRLRLDAEGVSATIANELLQGVVGELPLGWATAPRVAVRRADEAAARAVLAAFLARPSAGGDDRCLACGAGMSAADTCPECGWTFASGSGAPEDSPADLTPVGMADVPATATTASASVEPGGASPWAELAAVLAVGVVPNLAAAVATACHPSPAFPFRVDAAYGLVLAACTIVATLYLMKRAPEGWAGFGVGRPRVIDLATALVLAEVCWIAARLASGLPQDGVPSRSAYPAPDGSAELALAAARNLVSAFSEELVTRAYLVTRLATLLRSRTEAVIGAAVLFAAYHLNQGPAGAAGVLLMGLGYGAAFLLLRRVWPLAIGHALYNTVLDLKAS